MFGLLVLVGLFVALTPGVFFRLKGSKKVSAAMHAVLFGVVVYVVSMFGVSIEGFQAGTDPICPPGSSYTDGLCRAKMTCPAGTKFDEETMNCIDIKRKPSMPTCPKGNVLSNNSCREFVVGSCPPGLNGPEDGQCMADPSCPGGSILTNKGRCETPFKPVVKPIDKPVKPVKPAQPGTPVIYGDSGDVPMADDYIRPKIQPTQPAFAPKIQPTQPGLAMAVLGADGLKITVGSVIACASSPGSFTVRNVFQRNDVFYVEGSPNGPIPAPTCKTAPNTGPSGGILGGIAGALGMGSGSGNMPTCPTTHKLVLNDGRNLANYGQSITTALCLSDRFPPVKPSCAFGKLVGNICM